MLMFGFSDPSLAPPNIEVWIDGKMMSSFIVDKFIIATLPKLKANEKFNVDIVNYLYLENNQPKSIITIITEDEQQNSIIAQKIISLEKAQILDDIELIFLMESNSGLDSFTSNALEMIIKIEFSLASNDVLRLMLPDDFPPNYVFNNQKINCKLTNMVGNSNLGFTNVTVPSSCEMKGTIIDITINTNIIMGEDYLNIKVNIEGIIASPFFGKCGDFKLILFNSSKIVKGINFRSFDSYTNPIIIQRLNQIITTINDEEFYFLSLVKGTIQTVILKTDEIVLNYIKLTSNFSL